jgi:hypothetical protein
LISGSGTKRKGKNDMFNINRGEAGGEEEYERRFINLQHELTLGWETPRVCCNEDFDSTVGYP